LAHFPDPHSAHRLDRVEIRMDIYLPEAHGQISGQTEKGCEEENNEEKGSKEEIQTTEKIVEPR
jgi:hypothetical protein|tara:strand:- start:138 stop:329 length:192 start_codon:yes stop_codon:yes gene_type:complete